MTTDEVPSDLWTSAQADGYDDPTATMFAPALLESTTSFLAELAADGRALEFAIGTGRVAIPLHARGVDVTGIEYSAAMAAVLEQKTSGIPVVIGDMASTRVDGQFTLVYLVFNTIGNLFTQDAQVECFRNAARHLAPEGRFVVETGVPALRQLPPGQQAIPFDVSADHVGFDTYDLVTQRAVSHHYSRADDGRIATRRTIFAMSGRRNSTSWPAWRPWNSRRGSPTGTSIHSMGRARHTSRSGVVRGEPTSVSSRSTSALTRSKPRRAAGRPGRALLRSSRAPRPSARPADGW